MLFASMGLILTLSYISLTQQIALLFTFFLSFFLITGISLVFFYLDLFGGADAKALICLSLATPNYPTIFSPALRMVLPFFPLSIFNNTVFLSTLMVVYTFIRNIVWRLKTGRKLFEGFESESPLKKLVVLFIGYKMMISDLMTRKYLYTIEEMKENKHGEITRKLSVFKHSEVEKGRNLMKIKELAGRGVLSGEIWVTPTLPLLVFITAGFVMALFLGDIVYWLVTFFFGGLGC